MDFDPEFEFECPKWFDFEIGEGESEQAVQCLDDAWFEREHPLHEPKDKEKNDRDLKPLIDLNDKKITSTTTTKTTKYKNSKKSLGVKRSVRLKRGSTGKRKLPEIDQINGQNSSEKNSNSRHDNVSEENKLPKDGTFCQNRDFAPTLSVGSPSRADKCKEREASPLKALLYSPLRGPPISPVSSPKRTLLAKAVSIAADTNGQRKRRRLPTIPCENSEVSTLLPQRGNSYSDDTQRSQSANKSKIMAKTPVTSPFGFDTKSNNSANPQMIPNQVSQKSIIATRGHEYNDDTSNTDMSVEDLLKLHNRKVMDSKSKYDSNGRRVWTDDMSLPAAGTKCSKEIDSRSNRSDSNNAKGENVISLNTHEENKTASEEISLEDLLKLHNKKVAVSKCKYDSNGRRIQPANPAFCPAPSKSDAAETTRTKNQKSPLMTMTSKRPPSSNDSESKANPKAKHHRRSCVIAQSTNKEILRPHHDNKRVTEVPTSTTLQHDSKGVSSTLKRQASESALKSTQKSKRRSCFAAPGSNSSTDTGTGMGGATQKSLKQKRRSCFVVPVSQMPRKVGGDSEVDQELKDLITRHNQRLAKFK